MMSTQSRAENPSVPTDEVCEECGEKWSLHDFDENGEAYECTGDQYVEAHLERTRAAAKRTAVLFVEEFGEAFDRSKSDWDSEAFAADWRGQGGEEPICRGSVAEESDEIRSQCFEVYMDELEAETERLAEMLA